ncbi:Isoaspartyl aminopeptidase @ Asp-X dipeptidase [hydrothermal vent metagenome]|uniref:Isoaspartyl aminopeptidase @ Asp-X dipeptidase n=1 Tax=hydrothermal vent metagenome TaxID=652676 RepID=A0A3B0SNZ6_9ZZZZ
MGYKIAPKILSLAILSLAILSANSDLPLWAGEKPVVQGSVQIPDIGSRPDWVIAIHGGAGVKAHDQMTPELAGQYRAVLGKALKAGAHILKAGGDGPKAIEAAIMVMEDSSLFNAGRGAALDSHGNARHDASIMNGANMDAGAIAGSTRIRNPIAAARAVMERTENVLIAGSGADWFAAEQGLSLADPLYFQTERRRNMLLKKRENEPGKLAEHGGDQAALFGTVGAVVLDRDGNISAGTSTGGRTNKRYGRIGDSPIIGAGTYASNGSCAVSATGHGEYFMRYTVARDICARMEFAGETLEQAAGQVVIKSLKAKGGDGAVIAIDPEGKVVFSMNGSGMYRGVMTSETPARTAIYADEMVSE